MRIDLRSQGAGSNIINVSAQNRYGEVLIGRGGQNMRQIAEATTAKIRVRGKGSALASFYKIRLDQVHLKLCTPSKQFVFEIVKLLNYDFLEN